MDLNKIQTETDSHDSDKKLFSILIKKRDKEAFIRAYDLYVDKIYRFVYFKISNQEEAQDLTSAIFLKTWNYIANNKLENSKTLRALIYKIARNSIIDYYRKNYQTDFTINNINKFDIPDNRQNIVEKLEIASDYKIIESKLHELKDEYKEVIILRFVDQLSIGEIADIINKSKSNVRVLIHRALKALRELVDDIN